MTNLLPTRHHSPQSDKGKIGTVMFQMLEKKRQYYLGSKDLLKFRLWAAFVPSILQGLTHASTQEQPTSVAAFLALNRFTTPRDEENRGAGYTPLMLAGVSSSGITTHATSVIMSVLPRLQACLGTCQSCVI